MNRLLWLFVFILTLLTNFSYSKELAYFFSEEAEYDPSILSPSDFFGFEIGDRHLQHHELSAYVKSLAKSDRVSVIDYGRTFGNRPLHALLITSAANQNQIDQIRHSHLKLSDPESSRQVDASNLPAVIWMGYGVHGNEPSASNAAVLVAYHLAACRSDFVNRVLDNTIVLLDPCLNPDGFDRFANWSNSYRGAIANPDPQHREHTELSPTGRTNYYWFDLNRDWMPARQPESQDRLKLYREWMPNVVLDYHEMGANSTYFFQPGVPSRSNPLSPKSNLELTREFAKYHAKALDSIGSLYFTEERFDDYYIGKGSTYPDLRGAVGILFEQASARGQKQDTTNGVLEFEFAIRNQVTTSMSSLQATLDNRVRLHEHMRSFYIDSVELAKQAEAQAYLFSAGNDRARADEFIRLMNLHGIEIHELAKEVTAQGKRFKPGRSYLIRANQPEYRLLLAMTESRKSFEDKVFYDISAWSVPLAFGLNWAPWKQPLTEDMMGERVNCIQIKPKTPRWADDDFAYLVAWNNLNAPRTLQRLHEEKIFVKASLGSFEAQLSRGTQSFPAGTLMIPCGIQQEKLDAIRETLECAIEDDHAIVRIAKSGLTPSGIDLGSSLMERLIQPQVMLVVGLGTSDYEAGEIWFHLDRNLRMPVSLVDSVNLGSINLDRYTHVILVSGTYTQVSDRGAEKLSAWLRRGGTLVSLGNSARWLDAKSVASFQFRKPESESKGKTRLPYAESAGRSALQAIEGAIFATDVDLTHPLAFGLSSAKLPVFRGHTMFLEPSSNPFSTPLIYSKRNTLLSGYASDKNVKIAEGSAAVLVKSEGAGRVIVIPDNPVFRGYWYGSQRLLENSLFFGNLTSEPKETE